MTRYKNLNGHSGVKAYDIADKAITVHFENNESYIYTYQTTGQAAVERMKTLVRQGSGLSTYISQHVRERYETKL